MTRYGAGRIRFWDGGSLWIGRASEVNAVHAHHAGELQFYARDAHPSRG